jgi:hypothetical protein
MKYTKGPWKFWNKANIEDVTIMNVPPENDSMNGIGWDFKRIGIGNENDVLVAEVMAMTTGAFLHDFEEWEGNSKLIAAAPELLEALKELIKVATETTANIIGFDGAEELDNCIDAAKAVIQKVTNEATKTTN